MSALRKIDCRDQFATIGSMSDLLGLAWLCEQAANWQDHVGDQVRADTLYRDASDLRSAAVNQ
jgi:hypothetical protein